VLPDASTGQSPGTLARRLSRCKEGMAHFLPSRYKFRELYECRGTMLIGAANLSPVTNLVAGTGAVSRYKADRSQKVIKVYKALLGVVRESGCNGHYEFVLGAGAKAKSVTNNLPLLSVLAVGIHFLSSHRKVYLVCKLKSWRDGMEGSSRKLWICFGF
jgi:hypothetical protein